MAVDPPMVRRPVGATENEQGTSGLSEEPALNTRPTDLIERTLAVPSRPRIDDRGLLGEAATLDALANESGTVATAATSDQLDGLRDPVHDRHYHHAYEDDGATGTELGRGGIGRVVLVFDRTLGRDVAMKELLPDLANCTTSATNHDASHAQRFLREARITGQLEHPNIVPVYELGRDAAGGLYYTMRAVKGRTLATAIRKANSLSQRLALVNHFAGICHAIAYAHSRGVIHRDIKPENVMIGEFGETCVLDWGLATIIEESSPRSLRSAGSLSVPPRPSKRPRSLAAGTATDFHTQLGTIIGTPQYMSPEQLVDPVSGYSPRSDVWALGVVLYHILTGTLPYKAATFAELIASIINTEHPKVSQINPTVPKDLAAIVERAMAKDPKLRYASAADLARDVTAYQAGEKVNAYEYSSFELLRRFYRRHRSTLTVAGSALACLIFLAAGSYARIAAARDSALAAERRAVEGENLAKLSLSDVLVERAKAELSQGDPASAMLLASGALELTEGSDARGLVVALANTSRLIPEPLGNEQLSCEDAAWNAQLLQLGCRQADSLTIHDFGPALGHLSTHFGRGNVLPLGAQGWLMLSQDHPARIIGPDHRSVSWQLPITRPALFANAENGDYFAHVDESGVLTILTRSLVHSARKLRLQNPITAIAFHPDERIIALGDYRGGIYTWRWENEETAGLMGNSHATVRAVAFAPRGSQLVTGGSDGTILVWNTQQRTMAVAPERAASPIADLSFSPEGSHVAVATRGGVVDVLDAENYERTTRFARGKGITQLEFSGNGQLLGLGEKQEPFRLMLKEAQPSARFWSRGNVLSLAWASNHTDLLVSGLGERGICHLDLARATCGGKLPVRAALVRKVVYLAEYGLYAIGGTGGRIEFWDAEQKLPRTFLDVPIPEVRDLMFLQQERALAIVGNAPALVTIDLERMQIKDHQQLPSPAQSLHLLRERGLLTIGLRNGQLVFRSLATGQLGNEAQFVSGWPIGIAASERDNWIAVADDGGKLSFFELGSHRRLESLSVDTGRLTAFAHSERQKLIAIGGESRSIHLITTTAPRRIIARVEEHQGTVRTLLFDPARARLFSGGDDGLVRLWELGLLRYPAAQLRKEAAGLWGLTLEAGKPKPL